MIDHRMYLNVIQSAMCATFETVLLSLLYKRVSHSWQLPKASIRTIALATCKVASGRSGWLVWSRSFHQQPVRNHLRVFVNSVFTTKNQRAQSLWTSSNTKDTIKQSNLAPFYVLSLNSRALEQTQSVPHRSNSYL